MKIADSTKRNWVAKIKGYRFTKYSRIEIKDKTELEAIAHLKAFYKLDDLDYKELFLTPVN